MSTLDAVIQEVRAEVAKATEKFPTWPTRGLDAVAILGEEFGELTKEVLQLTYEPWKSTRACVRKEAVQTAAMALRFLMSLHQYDYTPGVQHSQTPPKPAPPPKAPTCPYVVGCTGTPPCPVCYE